MKYAGWVFMWLIVAPGCFGQEDLSKILSFETEHPGGRLVGWGRAP